MISAITTYRTRSQLTNKLKGILFHRTISAVSNAHWHNKLEANLKSWREIPGPPALPIIGQLLQYFPGGELSNFRLDEMGKLFNKYGPMVRLNNMFGMKAVLLLGDPELTAHILRNENTLPIRPGFASLEYCRREYRKRSKGNVRTMGLITDGEEWKEVRTIVNPVMLQPKTVKLYSNVMDEVAVDMIKRLKASRDEKNRLRCQFDHEMKLWALESIAIVALGCRINCLDTSSPKDSPQNQLIQAVDNFFETVNDLDFKPSLWRYVTTPKLKKAMRLYERIDTLTMYFLKQGIEQLKLYAGQKSDNEKSVLEKLLEVDEEVAHVIAADMLFGGVDTVSNNMIATVYLMATNRDKQEKLREEILSKPTDHRPYLRACMKEAMRLMPVGVGNIRTTTKEYNLMGYKIPKDMNILFAHQEMSLMDQHYPRAREFIPERWIAKKGEPLYHGDAHPFVYSPFGFGVRTCLGRRFAELETESLLARIVENFDMEWVGPPPRNIFAPINYIKGPFHFIFNDVK